MHSPSISSRWRRRPLSFQRRSARASTASRSSSSCSNDDGCFWELSVLVWEISIDSFLGSPSLQLSAETLKLNEERISSSDGGIDSMIWCLQQNNLREKHLKRSQITTRRRKRYKMQRYISRSVKYLKYLTSRLHSHNQKSYVNKTHSNLNKGLDLNLLDMFRRRHNFWVYCSFRSKFRARIR